MPRFFFHLRNDLDVPDVEGKVLADLEAARAHASAMARFELAEAAKLDGRIVLSHRIDIEDEEHTLLASVSFNEAVSILQLCLPKKNETLPWWQLGISSCDFY